MDDDEFGDDDLDGVPDNTLDQLEQQAFSSTQRPKSHAGAPPQKSRIQTFSTGGLTRNGNANRNVWKPPRPQKPQPAIRNGPPPSAPAPPSPDYGLHSDDVIIDQDDPSMVIERTSALPSRTRSETPAQSTSRNARYASKAPIDHEALAAFARADAEMAEVEPGAQGSEEWFHAPHLQPVAANGADVSSLQARIAELETEKALLRQSEQEARNAVQAKQGEISIVRANQDKATKEYERRIAVMQKLHSDEAAKQKADLEAGRKEREKMQTDNQFLKHDLAQESERRRLNGPDNPRADRQETPRKTKRTAFGDGFDDDEVRIVSPSKSRDKSREQTPKVGAKRKRPAQDSPTAPLVFDQPPQKDSVEQLHTVLDRQKREVEEKEKSRFSFMQKTLNHRPYEGHERTVEALTKHHFPSDPEKSLSAMFMESMTSQLGGEYLPLRLSRTMLQLWSRCLDEKHYPPFYLILDMVRFAIRLELSSTISELIEEAVPLCNRTMDLKAADIARANLYPLYAASPEFEKVKENIVPHIDVDEILEFLRDLCDAASLSPHYIELFWREREFESALLMLNKAQPISQITAALQILASSALPTTFGAICGSGEGAAERQAKQERDTIDRLTSLLLEMPMSPKDEPAYTDEEIMELRIEILNVLKTLSGTDHGGLLLAQHRSVIGRLIRFLDGQVNKLYTSRPSLGLPSTETQHLHTLITQTINTATRIIYHLFRTYDSHIDFLQKLRVVRAGYHKFLVSMTRIAFSDRMVFEEGLDEEVVEAAHQILDSVLSPEEGEAVVKAVETPRGTKGTSTERDSQETRGEAMEEDPG